MCCLFGLIDTELRFTGKEKSKMFHALASASEARGTDATGVAYDYSRTLHIYKRPIPGHKLNFYLRNDTRFAMGHTRMTTQGIARRNYNNHPFRGIMQAGTFALAHNGVLDNDFSLRKSLHLPRTRIETDSYIAVQLIEQKGILNFDSLRYMAELLEGSFTITVLGMTETCTSSRGITRSACTSSRTAASTSMPPRRTFFVRLSGKFKRPSERAGRSLSDAARSCGSTRPGGSTGRPLTTASCSGADIPGS